MLREVQRLDAKTIPGQEEALLLGIPDGEREDPVEPLQHGLAERGVHGEHYLGVAIRAEAHALRLQLSPELREVV